MNDFSELAVFLDEATVIGIGESTHGSNGLLNLRARLTKYLILEKGVRAITLETPWGPALEATHYVETCQGSPIDATKSLFFVWQAKEIVQFMKWLCEFNRSRAVNDRVKLFGHEVMYQPWYDSKSIRSFLDKAAENDISRLMESISSCSGVLNPVDNADEYYLTTEFAAVANGTPFVTGVPVVDDLSQSRCRDGLGSLEQYAETNREQLILASSLKELERMRLSVDSLKFNQDMYYYSGRDIVKHSEARDEGAALVFTRLKELEFPNARRSVVWAHNAHVALHGEKLGPENNIFVGGKVMGSYLRRAFGERYVSIGVFAYRAKLKWPLAAPGHFKIPFATTTYEMPQPGGGTVEHALLQFGEPLLVVDPAVFLESGKYQRIGGGSMVPSEQHNAIVFLKESDAMEFWWEP